MHKESRYSYAVAQKQSIYPSKLVIYNDVIKWDNVNQIEVKHPRILKSSSIERKFHNFEISSNSRQKLIKKISWLFQCAKTKHVKTYSGKEIYNFKVNFITLTLPSKQVHPTSQITKECFERFLNEMRTRCKVVNYVWRLEFQENGNVHYHLVTDTYIDYQLILRVWNRIINYLGYVDAYASEMSKLSFPEYHSKMSNCDFETSHKRYIKGRAEKWQNPNSVDVKSANSKSNIAVYIAKYFSKKHKEVRKCNPLDNEENSFGLRLWFCSRSLSKLDCIKSFVEVADIHLENLLENMPDVKKIVFDYCTVIYFNFAKLTNYGKQLLGTVFRDYSLECNYQPSN